MSSPVASAALVAALASGVILSIDSPATVSGARGRDAPTKGTACDGARPPLAHALFFELRSGAFPGTGHPDAAVHVPPGFDATERPGLILYLHGWRGCAAAAFSSDAGACDDAGAAGVDLASQIDDSGVNALFIALETRFFAASGEPGQLAMPGGGRDLIRELLSERLAGPLGCPVALDAIDRIAVVAHSGGYQGAAGLLTLGDLPRVSEVVLLDSLYGADDTFAGWIEHRSRRFGPGPSGPLHFVDLYTSGGGTADPSRALARRTRDALTRAAMPNAVFDDDAETDLLPTMLGRPVVFKRVPLPHSALPGAYLRAVVEAAGFSRIPSRP